jgi:hypothetical protein
MENINIEYLKANTLEEEFEIEKFWFDIRTDIYKIEEDHSLLSYNIKRGHASAYLGEYAGIFIHILITILPLTDSTLSIWEKIYNHLKNKREKKEIVRVLNLTLLVNICKVDLIINNNVKNAELVKSEKLVDLEMENLDSDMDFTYDDTLNKVDCAKIIFENKKYKYLYVIASDGEITNFERKEK